MRPIIDSACSNSQLNLKLAQCGKHMHYEKLKQYGVAVVDYFRDHITILQFEAGQVLENASEVHRFSYQSKFQIAHWPTPSR